MYAFHLQDSYSRGDYRELLQLTILFLGENLDGENKFCKPGATH